MSIKVDLKRFLKYVHASIFIKEREMKEPLLLFYIAVSHHENSFNGELSSPYLHVVGLKKFKVSV